MLPLHRDPGWTFPFGDDRLIPAFFLPGAQPGLRVHITRDGETIREAVVGEAGRVDLVPPLVVRAGEVLLVLPAPAAG